MAGKIILTGVSLLTMASVALIAAPGDAKQKKAPETVTSISAKDKATGAKAHPELLQEYGGAYAGTQVPYVTMVGKKIAVQSGLSNSQNDFTITLLNSPVNNAFAIPGGYVYVTRQLMALMNDEAELASVLGHEVGHVAARHSQKRQSTATTNSIIGLLGQVAAGALLGNSGFGQLLQKGIGTGTQLLTLKYSRTQEYQADDLGITYLAKAGYDPVAASTMLASLAAQTAIEARVQGGTGRSTPEWASTHPDPASRVQRALNNAKATGFTRGVRNRDAFLTALNGVLYDDDPHQGVIDGAVFSHPDLKLKFTVPQGFAMSNAATAVSITGSGGQAQFSGGAIGSGGLNDYIDRVFQGVTGQSATIPHDAVQRTKVNGMDAAYATGRANTQSGEVAVTVFAYQFDAQTAYHFVAITPVNNAGVFNSLYQSMTRMTAAEIAAIKPRKIQVVTVQKGQNIATLSARMAYRDYQQDRFMVLNALSAGAILSPGQKVKIVTY